MLNDALNRLNNISVPWLGKLVMIDDTERWIVSKRDYHSPYDGLAEFIKDNKRLMSTDTFISVNTTKIKNSFEVQYGKINE